MSVFLLPWIIFVFHFLLLNLIVHLLSLHVTFLIFTVTYFFYSPMYIEITMFSVSRRWCWVYSDGIYFLIVLCILLISSYFYHQLWYWFNKNYSVLVYVILFLVKRPSSRSDTNPKYQRTSEAASSSENLHVQSRLLVILIIF